MGKKKGACRQEISLNWEGECQATGPSWGKMETYTKAMVFKENGYAGGGGRGGGGRIRIQINQGK